MSNTPEPGTSVTINGGAFHGYIGEVVSVDGAEAQVEVEVFGRKTEVVVAVADLTWGNVPALDRIRQEIQDAWRKWRVEATMQWWKDRVQEFETITHTIALAAYQEFQVYQEEVLRALDGQTVSEVEAALRAFPEAEWNQHWDENKSQWLSRFEIEKVPRDATLDRANRFISQARDAAQHEEQAIEQRELQRELREYQKLEFAPENVIARQRSEGFRMANRLQQTVHEYLQHTQGVTLPDHLLDFAACWKGLTEPEYAVWRDFVWLTPGGLLSVWDYYEETDRITASHHDLLVARYYRDPPEFYTIMQGDGDGSHYGLWYDDPAEPACCVAHYWNRDPTPIHTAGSTALEVIREKLEDNLQQAEPEDRVRYLHLLEVVLGYDSATPREPSPQRQRIPTCDGMGVWVPGEENLKRDVEEIEEIVEERGKHLTELVQHVQRELDQGRPAAALALGRDLAWLSFGETDREELAASLMEASYRALNRDQFAITARVHQQHRHLTQVDSYELR